MKVKILFGIMAAMLIFVPTAIGERPDEAKSIRSDKVSQSQILNKVSIPRLINYQGYLTDAVGNPIADTIGMTFSIWDAVSDGGQLWNETQASVSVIDGLFNVLLGSVTPIPSSVFTGASRWLQTQVGAEILSPRKEIVSAAYVFRAGVADTAGYAPNSASATSADTAVYAYWVSTVDSATGGAIMGNVTVQSASSGDAFSATNSGTGRAGYFFTDSRGDALYSLATGTARAGYFEIKNSSNANEAFRAFTNGTGEAIFGESEGGTGVYAQTNSTADSTKAIHGVVSSTSALFSTAVRGENKGTFSLGYGVWGSHDGLGVGVYGTSNNGTGVYGSTEIGTGVFGTSADGSAGFFSITEAANSNPALYVSTDGTGDAAQFKGGKVSVKDDNFTTTVEIAPTESGSDGGQIALRKADGTTTIEIDGDKSDRAEVSVFSADGTAETVEILGNQASDNTGGFFTLRTSNGTSTILMDAEESSTGADIKLLTAGGTRTIELDAEKSGRGEISVYHNDGTTETVEIIGAEDGTGGQIKLRKADGTTTITLDAEHGTGGDGRIITSVLEITGGSDLSEQFKVRGSQANSLPSPGMVVCINPEHPGELIVSSQAYDHTVAGIVSGAGGVKPGMLMGQSGSVADGKYPVALSGRVYCWADASYGPIQPGDLLTTSETEGHVMKVIDYTKAQGAIIGKAMTSLEEGQGLILVLVSLQ